MSMIDEMAKSMYLAYANHPDARWDAVDPRMQENVWRAHARAALTVLLKPTSAMWGVLEKYDDLRGENSTLNTDTWQLMIQAALDGK